jgi:hypothetical protein
VRTSPVSATMIAGLSGLVVAWTWGCIVAGFLWLYRESVLFVTP